MLPDLEAQQNKDNILEHEKPFAITSKNTPLSSSQQCSCSCFTFNKQHKYSVKEEVTTIKTEVKLAILYQRIYAGTYSVIIFIFFLFMYGIVKGYNLNFSRLPDTTPSPRKGFTNIVLLGDSLIEFPFTLFNLGGILSEKLTDYKVNIYNEGKGSDNIKRIRARLPEALAHKPDVLFLLFDTDISDTYESKLNSSEVVALRARYEANVKAVVNDSLAAGTQHVVMSGPILLGEGPWMRKTKFQGKAQMVKDYLALNERIAMEMNVTYLNLREHFLAEVPSSWPLGMWMVTFDGEHPNQRGTQLIASALASSLQPWLDTHIT